MPYLVDTDILVDYLRENQDAVAYLQSLDEWSYSVVTAMELFAGAKNNRDVRILEKLLNRFDETPLSREIGNRGRDIMKRYVKSDGLDPLDAMIAATAIVEGLILSTRNKKHFRAIRGLKIESPPYA